MLFQVRLYQEVLLWLLQESKQLVSFLLICTLVQEEELLENIYEINVTGGVAAKLEAIQVFLMEISDKYGIILFLLF